MKNKVLLVVLLQFLVLLSFAQQQDIDIITKRLVDRHIQEKYDRQGVERYISTMKPDGSWGDLDYDIVIREYPVGAHLTRLINMTLAYSQKGSEFTDSESLLNKILLGMDYFYTKRPRSTNWWWNDIGAPQRYMTVLILLKGKIDKEKLLHYSSYLEDKTDNAAHKGKNRTWVSSITMHKGCIEDKYELVSIGFESIASTMIIADSKMVEGIKTDNSIHQHRPQLYSGGYGMSFMYDLAEYIYLSSETSFDRLFTPEKKKIFIETMLGGQQLFGYRKTFDIGTEGRNISRINHVNNISPELLDLMKIIDPQNASAYDAWKDHLRGKSFPKVGNKFFWNSAIVTHHGKNYYLSAKVISSRTNGTEMLNGENLLGYYLPLGMTNILNTGKEYYNIFPVWSWNHLPGTTSSSDPSTAKLEGYHFGTNKYAGGVSNGKNGCIAFEHDYRNIKAKKSYFFIGDAMLCMGTDISSTVPHNIMTTLNQCFADGDVYVSANNKVERLQSDQKTFEALDWAHHSNTGYILVNKQKTVVQKKKQAGSWYLISDTNDDKEVSADIFNLWVDHGAQPQSGSYCYIVMPDISLFDFEKASVNHGFEIIKNDIDIQAVRSQNLNTYAVVFYKPGTIILDKNLELSVDKEAIVLVEKNNGGYLLSVSDPLYEAKEINIIVNEKLKGKNSESKGNFSYIQVILPQGEYAGKPVTNYYNIVK